MFHSNYDRKNSLYQMSSTIQGERQSYVASLKGESQCQVGRPCFRAAAVSSGRGEKDVSSVERDGEGFPSFIPREYIDEIEEPAALEVLRRMQMANLSVMPELGLVKTAYVYEAGEGHSDQNKTAFVLLHGFDSSMLEFRRFIPLLKTLGDVYVVDLAGWGFSDCGFSDPETAADVTLGPIQKRRHLEKFVQDVVGRPVVLLGTSLGGSVAIDFAVECSEWVTKLVLVDAQGFIDGIGPMASMPRFLSELGVQVLKSVALRQMANKMAYFDKAKYATDDAMRIGRLHTHAPGWSQANVAFMQSGGYAVSSKVGMVPCPTLVVWGRQDEILDPKYAAQFMEVLPDAQLAWIEECGHVPALEQPRQLLQAIERFIVSKD
jgi:pimeloyl-ACP methyl ester carboxylesterase